MSDPIRVVVRRGKVIESVHRVHAVAVKDGAVVAEAGDGGLVTFMRSSAKPFQALPLARSRDDLTERDLAIASSSHLADPAQLEAVRALLAKASANEDDLECGAEGDPPSRLNHNCSGKHAGMLALCRARRWPPDGYRLLEHPVQQTMLAEIATAAEVDKNEIETAVDGCGLITFALPLERMAFAFARLPSLEGGARIAASMRAYPELIRGPEAPDTILMRTLAGWTAKGGAEGLHCAVGPDGLGIALKVEDGSMRAMRPALGTFLAQLGHRAGRLGPGPVRNSHGDIVGEIAVDGP
jgi:L-asparaginase